MRLIPENPQAHKVRCRYIPQNDRGETVDSLYRTGTQEELEAAMVAWLKVTIERLEHESAQRPPAQETSEAHVKATIISTGFRDLSPRP